MIIFGKRDVAVTQRQGSFFCPACRKQTPYRLQAVRRFFTLFFLPLIPLDRLGEHVLCQTCKGQYATGILEVELKELETRDPTAFLADLRRTLVLMMIADGTVDDEEVEALGAFLERQGGAAPTPREIGEEVNLARRAVGGAAAYVRGIAPYLGEAGKHKIIQGAFLIASATGELKEPQRKQLELLPGILQVSDEQFRAIVAQASEEA